MYRGNPHSGGQGVYTKYLTRELALMGHRVEVFSGPPYPEVDRDVGLHRLPSLDLYREPDPFRVPKLSEFKDVFDIGEFLLMATGAFPEPRSFGWRLRRELYPSLGQFDVVHDNQSLSWSVLRMQQAGVPVVASIHHPITVDRRLSLEYAESLKQRLGLLRFYGFVRMQCLVAARLRHVLTVSNASARDIAREMGVDLRRMAVGPVGVDMDVFRPLPLDKEQGLVVTTASADVPLKGLRYLIEAVAILRSTGSLKDLHLVVMGPTKQESPVQRLVQRLGLGDRIRFVGKVSTTEMVQYYSKCQVAVVPSLYEGFSLPSIEAMACGAPLVVTDGGALPEVVDSEGSESALVVRAGDAEALAQAIGRLLDNPEIGVKLSKNALIHVRNNYSWRRSAESALQMYQRAIEEAR
ncbi:Glycosyltransferase involved in cell wall bisynthesis [Ferrithrix thermotolerans DSM 19514]|uniref:Glycosyltransferase involved in cell wall bisynthesis n=1 Tax=Ferrithrix thermotolerans DSM 19514 TaxID=1121881 RepID=A0A1M4X1B8_9ACTN|nr:glycosyltransferase family 4 protein [Ferrithrix thermotolerans]SHE87289.1 Glycosyltransferase involved in cell wall bisynthesis [Ferrithrix thermotolerans DSM 19514]